VSIPRESPSVAVAIPCFNEAAAIASVVTAWRAALPEAEVVVFDNNSTDGSGAIARDLGARVVPVPRQGKGCVVRVIFAELADRAAVVMIDGDGTYPPEAVGALLMPVLEGAADMTVGARRPVAELGAMSPLRGIGNRLIRIAFRVLIGRVTTDPLSGYRVFSRQFMRTVPLRSTGFEIETELVCEAVAHRARVVEVPVPYYPRIAGTTSKLRAFHDGWRILRTIFLQGLRLRPWRIVLLITALAFLVAALAALVWGGG
jgi:glycosyltransferase involved in cell wall biosynthesis